MFSYRGYSHGFSLSFHCPIKNFAAYFSTTVFDCILLHCSMTIKKYSICCSLVLFLFPAKEVKKAPMFLEKLQNCGVPEGYPVRLECRVVGMPPPVFYWKKDNETIPSNRERMRYCNSIPIIEVSCSQTNCFYHTAFY